MAEASCIVDGRVGELSKLLIERWGVSEEELDSGYSVMDKGSTSTQGAGDGCSSYREVIGKAIEIATAESLDCGGSSLIRALDEKFNIRLPWIIYNKSFMGFAEFNLDGWRVAAAEIEAIRRSIPEGDEKAPPAEERTRLARKIFDELLPVEEMRAGSIDPHSAVFKLFMAYRAAGIEASFVLLSSGPLGIPTPNHVALKLKAGAKDGVIVDPAYEAFNLKGLNATEISLNQALAIHYARLAITEEEFEQNLKVAKALDPTNSAIGVWQLLANSPIDDPFRSIRESERLLLKLDREAVRNKKMADE